MAIAAGLACGACIYDYPDKDCVEPGSGLRVMFDWSADPTAAPEGMSTLFYPVGGGDYWQYELPLEGGVAGVPDGEYNIVCFNNDTSSILFENQDDYDKALVTTRAARLTDGFSTDYPYSQPPRRGAEASQPVVAAPDVVWGGSRGRFRIDGNDTLLVLHPAPLVARYTVTVTHVVNIESASQVSMALSGLSAGRMLSTSDMIPVDVTVPASMRRTGVDTLGGWMLAFGRDDDAPRCLLSIYVMFRDGTRKVYEYDVTGIVDNAPDPLDVHIPIEGLEFPEVDTSSGTGMEVGVDDWDVVEIELST